ncbi:MAG: low molecular weight phosphotyrosine protein phosphatase [Candidatus Thiodiazotropha taylori]|nr:low molecular weight phosphotyrosine protein phosphatase [Candidatus Thiodiazotropha taylori]MCG8028029.1 low molecular weight phosphotyrosine protein phosphatase [Candidatus Thiodiazotropha taylori]MCG8108571.1 low molecular weight phosphotyrosine protein phosphatase [Candidatus Thiodiazotropha taylori]MCG8112399.1 low molecular weight phosphotyrosine protein phosphatase [Candidatus Thiodiazotropha taylori]MCW4280909.1 low molecular weight phosphotyrosine protein phosphatase [Candidatus Thi
MTGSEKIEVLFVCMGNICRSPTAQGVFRDIVEKAGLSDRIITDSAGTIDYHAGGKPDRRARETANKRGIDLSDLRARQVRLSDFDQFDYVLAMDRSNYEDLRALCPSGEEHRLHLFMDFAPGREEQEVPDPYYGGAAGFENVFDMVEEASLGLLEHIRQHTLMR